MDDTTATEPGWGDRLVEAHNVLRGFVTEAQAASLTGQLRNHCRTVCAYLHGHHTTEDSHFFPHLARVRPDLAPALDRLRREHVVVDRILTELDALSDHQDVRATLDRLTAELENHFAYEEEQLVPALNALTGPVPWDSPSTSG